MSTVAGRRTGATAGTRAVALLRAGDTWMGDELIVSDEHLAAEYAFYGTSGWEELRAYDTAGEVRRRDLHSWRAAWNQPDSAACCSAITRAHAHPRGQPWEPLPR
jgi:hypothetical protein